MKDCGVWWKTSRCKKQLSAHQEDVGVDVGYGLVKVCCNTDKWIKTQLGKNVLGKTGEQGETNYERILIRSLGQDMCRIGKVEQRLLARLQIMT